MQFIEKQHDLTLKALILHNFLVKKPFATKHSSPSNVYYMEFYPSFLIEYTSIGIVKPKFSRRTEI